jgi:cbb3-type cytochrome oxidase cytochrome c subunit
MQMNMHIRTYPILQLETSKETLFCFIAILNITVTVGSPCFIPYKECEAASTLICYNCYHCHSRAFRLFGAEHNRAIHLIVIIAPLYIFDQEHSL